MAKIDDALDLLDLRDWFEDYTDLIPVGDHELRIRECPNCGKDKFKFFVNTEKRLFNCYHCAWGYGIYDICVAMAGVSGRHINDIKLELANSVVPVLPDEEYAAHIAKLFDQKFVEEPLEIEPTFIPGNVKFGGLSGKRVRDYGLSRGITEEMFSAFKLRFSVRLRNFRGYFLVFPIYFKGMAVGWQGRRITNSEPRYVSTDHIANWLWPIDQHLDSIERTKAVILVEGVFDAIALWKLGVPGLCTFGKKITRNQVKLLKKLGVRTLYLAWDPDAWEAIQKAAERLTDIFNVRIVIFEQDGYDKLDPGDALVQLDLNEWIVEGVEQAIEVNSDEYHIWKVQTRFG